MDADDTSRHAELLVVPHRPGPLIELPPERRRDEIDDVLDELFGEAPRDTPGAFDAVLVAGGAALAVAALAAGLPAWLLWLGTACAAFGLILPLHHAWTRIVRARSLRRVREVMGQGTLLDAGHPATRRLTRSYRRVERSAADGLGRDALESAHLAVLEVAGLLRGRRPESPAEREYVNERADAVARLAATLERPVVKEMVKEVAEEVAEPPVDENSVRDSAVQALRDLDERTGSGSLVRMEQLNRLLDEEGKRHGTA
jgi:hypothetical protein